MAEDHEPLDLASRATVPAGLAVAADAVFDD